MKKLRAFTLLELLITVALISILAGILFVSIGQTPLQKARVAQALATADQMKTAIERYALDMGFYPPDVGRGWDPGLAQPFIYNPDTGQQLASCPGCPTDYSNWSGPYITYWPKFTPWGGKYDYNYWPAGASRYGCTVPAGVFLGIQGDYSNFNTIPPAAEQMLIGGKFEAEQCLNGESQLMLKAF